MPSTFSSRAISGRDLRLLEPHRRGQRDDPQRSDAGQVGDQRLGHAVGEELLLGIARGILQRQHRQRGERAGRRGDAGPGRQMVGEGEDQGGRRCHRDRRHRRRPVSAHQPPRPVEQAVGTGGDGQPREVTAEVLGQRLDGPVAPLGLLAQGLEDDGVEVPGQPLALAGGGAAGRGAGVPARAGEVDSEPVTEGHEGVAPVVDRVCRLHRVDMDRERGHGTGQLEVPVLQRPQGTAVGLLSGLEGQHDVMMRWILREDSCGAEQHGHVQVVAARVHTAWSGRGERGPRSAPRLATRPCRRAAPTPSRPAPCRRSAR